MQNMLRLLVAVRATGSAVVPPAHIVEMSAYGYNASAQAAWSTFGKSFNLTELVRGHATDGLVGVYRIDCIGCESLGRRDPGFASGVVCDYHNATLNATRVRLCCSACGDTTDWRPQTLSLLSRARPAFVSGALRGIFLGDEHTSNGMPFGDFEDWVDVVRAFLNGLPSQGGAASGGANASDQPPQSNRASAAAAHTPYMLYYTESDYVCTWPYVPPNLTHFSVDDYHPEWMYPGLWVRPIYERCVFPKIQPLTKLLVVPPTWGSHTPCTASPPSVWCTNQTYAQWVELGRGNFTAYRDWAYNDSRIVGFDPWLLQGHGTPGQPFELGLLQVPEILALYSDLGKAIKAAL